MMPHNINTNVIEIHNLCPKFICCIGIYNCGLVILFCDHFVVLTVVGFVKDCSFAIHCSVLKDLRMKTLWLSGLALLYLMIAFALFFS